MVLFLPCEGTGQQASSDSEAAVEPHLSTVTPELCPHHQQLLFVPSKTRWLMWATNHSTHTASGATLLGQEEEGGQSTSLQYQESSQL